MKVIIRTDSSFQIGSGHVMRCLTLADELRQRGADILFVCREHPGNMIDLIEGRGHQVVRLAKAETNLIPTTEDVAHAEWLGVSWQQDVKEVSAVVENIAPDWLVIDHYALDRRWEQVLRQYIGKIMVIDDLADRSHDCDLLLDQNLYREMETRYDTLVPKSCQKLLGPKYALLRPEFFAARNSLLRQRDVIVKRILVFFGGIDSTNQTEKTLLALAAIDNRTFEVDVIVGGGNSRKDRLQSICMAHSGFHFHCQIDNMAELMVAADLSIGAGGSTTWERCVVGLPSLVVTVAENQVNIADSADKAGVLSYLGKSSEISHTRLHQEIIATLSNENILQNMSNKALNLVDGGGVKLTADVMEQE